MITRTKRVTYLVLILGVVLLLVSFPFENYRVESVQSNGLPMISYPLYLAGFYSALLGIGMVVFGVVFMFSPVALMGFRRAVAGSALIAAGVPSILLSTFGVLASYLEWEEHSCGAPGQDPVCVSDLWGIVDFAVIGVVGVTLIVAGVYLRRRRRDSAVLVG